MPHTHTHTVAALCLSLSPSFSLWLCSLAEFVCSGALGKHKMGKLADTERQTNFIMGHCKVQHTRAHTAHTHTCTVECTHTHAARGWLSERIELKRLLVCNRFLSSRCSLQLKLFASPIDTSARPPVHPTLPYPRLSNPFAFRLPHYVLLIFKPP